MKRNMTLSMRVLGGWLIGAILLIGCNANDDDDHKPVSGNEAVKFNSWLSDVSSVSRASEERGSMTKEEWTPEDYIGVYMKENNKPLSDNAIIENVKNNKYISTKEGKSSTFIATNTNDEIYYPYNSPAVSFVAYYPYKNTITDYVYQIDINDQKENLEKVDLLYATFDDKSPESMNVPLTFHHQLTKLVLNLQPNFKGDKNAYFAGIKVRANGFYTKANFSLVDRLISDRDEIKPIHAKTTPDGKRVEMIIIPQTAGANTGIDFELFEDLVKWSIPVNKVFEAGKQYEYTLYLGTPWIEVDEKISSWGDEISVPVNWSDPKYLSVGLVKISGGDLLIGSPEDTPEASANEYPQHEASVGTFWISPYEITNKQYIKFLNYLVDQQLEDIAKELLPDNALIDYDGEKWFLVDSSKSNYPVTNVTWYKAKAFAEWLGGDLPSEAEWEVACRAGNYGIFSFSSNSNDGLDNLYPRYVNCRDESTNGVNEVIPVNKLLPNKNGLFNMHGNVAEWCRDSAGRNAAGAPPPYSYKLSEGEEIYRVIRGGSWRDYFLNCRSAYRDCILPESEVDYIGFRVVFPISNFPNLDFKEIESVLSID
jgi:formylglycine-generating enzyme required for sulfatase activity